MEDAPGKAVRAKREARSSLKLFKIGSGLVWLESGMPVGYGEICLLQTVTSEGTRCLQRPVCERAFAEIPWAELHLSGEQTNVQALPLRNFQAIHEKKRGLQGDALFSGCARASWRWQTANLTETSDRHRSCYAFLGSKGLAWKVLFFSLPIFLALK